MKKNIICGLVFFISIFSIAQSNDEFVQGLYKWTDVILIEPCDEKGKSIAGSSKISTKISQKFRVIDRVAGGTNVLIKFLDYTVKNNDSATKNTQLYNPTTLFYKYNFDGESSKYSVLSNTDKNSRSYGKEQKYFKVDARLLEKFALKEATIDWSLAIGVVNFPFKFRPQKDKVDFSGSFNFGAGLGVTFPHKSWRKTTHSLISGYSISNVVLDSVSVVKNHDKLSSTNNFTAFSFSLGYLIQYEKVQAGLFIGWDRINRINQEEFGWIYQGKSWLSIGFGLAIFSGGKETPDANIDTNK